MGELVGAERVELNIAVGALGLLIILLGISRHFLNTKFPASTVCEKYYVIEYILKLK